MYIPRSMLLKEKRGFKVSRGTHQIIKHLFGMGAVDDNITILNLIGSNQMCYSDVSARRKSAIRIFG